MGPLAGIGHLNHGRLARGFLRLACPALVVSGAALGGANPLHGQETLPPPAPASAAVPPAAAAPPLPVSLDTVLRLAEDQNAQIRLARARVREACALQGANPWLPDVYVGTTYYRHEGGIQNEDGTLTHSSTGALFAGMELYGKVDVQEMTYRCLCAQRRAYERQGEACRITSDKLLEATCAYLDLLAARTAAALFRGQVADLEALLAEVRQQAGVAPAQQIEVPQVEGELQEQRQAWRKAQEQAAAASAQLSYLLNLDPCRELVPVDAGLIPLDLVDVCVPTADLVGRALANGPGVRQLEKLLALSQQGLDQSRGLLPWLPTMEVRMGEGAFGAGPGDDMRWDNRWDLAVQARWNLTALAQARCNREAAQAQAEGAALAYEDLRGKLTAGVRQAQESAQSAHEQFGLASGQIAAARRALGLSRQRRQSHVTQGHTEELIARRAVLLAQLNYVNAVRAFDKAQLQLLILLGAGGAPASASPVPPPPKR
jgi:outer membrane protein TolC